jgi:serine/threonine protein kinase
MLESAKNYLDLQLGSYRLIRLLGEGTFSQVYLGEHIYLKTQNAIKLLRMQLSLEARENFLHEAQTIAKLEHPNIIRVFDYGVVDEIPFLVMKYAPNGSLRQRYPVGTCLPLDEIIPILKQIAPALDYAHRCRLIHRDVKPENILIGEQDQMFLSDFGLVLEAHSHSSQTVGKAAGTVLYMAPEQFQGNVRFASDQYALAIIAYQWLCGECPFKGTFTEIISQHLYTTPPLLSSRIPGFPRLVEKVILKALSKVPTERYENTVAFVNALEEASHSPLSHIDIYNTLSEAAASSGASIGAAALAAAIGTPLAASASSDQIASQANHAQPTSSEQKNPIDLLPASNPVNGPLGAQGSAAPQRFNPIWRIVLPLVALLLIIAGSVGIWYGNSHAFLGGGTGGGARPGQTSTIPGTPTAVKPGHNGVPPLGKPALTGTVTTTSGAGADNNGSSSNPSAGNGNATAPASGSGAQPTQISAPTPVTQPTTANQPTPIVDCLSGSPTVLVFSSFKKQADPAPQVVTLTNCGGTSGWNASTQTTDGNDWLSVSPSNDSIAPGGNENVEVIVTHVGIPRGTYQGTILFAHGSASLSVSITNIVKKDPTG